MQQRPQHSNILKPFNVGEVVTDSLGKMGVVTGYVNASFPERDDYGRFYISKGYKVVVVFPDNDVPQHMDTFYLRSVSE